MASNLNGGPWETLREDRRREEDGERQQNLRLFRAYCAGLDAARRGEAVRVPPHFTPEEKEQVRRGWTAARKIGDDEAEVEALESAFALGWGE